jgi:hypothetical protein
MRTVNDELEGIWKEAVMAYFKVVWKTEETNERISQARTASFLTEIRKWHLQNVKQEFNHGLFSDAFNCFD